MCREISNLTLTIFFMSSPGVALWHKKMSHFSECNLKLLESMADGVDLNKKPLISVFCETCANVNICAQFHDSHCTPSHFLLNLVHSDVGSFPITSFKGYNYYVAFEDDYTKFSEIYPMIHKSKVPAKFKEFKAANKTFTRQIHHFRSDNNGKYLHKRFIAFHVEHKIKWEPSTPNHQMQNGTTECFQQMLHKCAFAILMNDKFSDYWWAEMLVTVNYLWMKFPHVKLKMIPYEV